VADAYLHRVLTFCEGFANTPHRGTLCEDLGPGLRIAGWKRSLTLVWRVQEEQRCVQFIGLFYRGRDVATALADR
jgi:toxin ParE1/3/4